MNEQSKPDGFEERVTAAGGQILPPCADGLPTARVAAKDLCALVLSLKEGPGVQFDMLTDVCAVDEYPGRPRFDVIYHLRCLASGKMVRIKAFTTGENHEIPSVTAIHGTANWHEREAYDMMGIVFTGHPDLKRILMPLDFEHHPLRKDFPLEGIEPDKAFRKRFPDASRGSMHQKSLEKGVKRP